VTDRETLLKERYGEAYKWLAGFAVVLGLLTTIFSSTMINVALTDIMDTFKITQSSAQWMATGFLSASSVGMLCTAWLMQAVGPRLTFALATLLFIAGSITGWLCGSFELLIVARLLQGVGAGLTQPLSMALVFILFPAEIRGRAMGFFGMGVVLGPAFGPVIGGVIADNFGWQMTFIAAVPLSAIAAILGYLLLPDRKQDSVTPAFNLLSFLLITVAAGGLLTGLSNSQFEPFSDTSVYPYLVVSFIAFVLFLRREITSTVPLVQLKMFKDSKLISTAVVGAFTSAGLFASVYALPLFGRTVLDQNATEAGLLLFPAGIALVIVFPLVGRLIDSIPVHRLIVSGQVLFVISLLVISYADGSSSYLYLAGWILVSRIALGLIMPSNSTYSLSIVKPEEVTQASGALNFVRMLGGTIGVNLTALLITARTNLYSKDAELAGMDLGSFEAKITIFTHTFQDCFLVVGLVFSLALIPSLYVAFSNGAFKMQKSPAE